MLTIERIRKTSGLSRKIMQNNIGHLMDIKVVSRDQQLGSDS